MTGMRWAPVVVLGVGCLLSLGSTRQITPHLREPLADALPDSIDGVPGFDAQVSAGEAAVAGFTDYALRVYESADTTADGGMTASIYLGYYDHQTRGRTIHSPKNCLPGAGWEALTSTEVVIPTRIGPVPANKYLVQNGKEQALVLYWYQGRGRVAANEYLVKWNLLRDAALRQRSEEALVRIVVPVTVGEDSAFAIGRDVAERVAPALQTALPS